MMANYSWDYAPGGRYYNPPKKTNYKVYAPPSQPWEKYGKPMPRTAYSPYPNIAPTSDEYAKQRAAEEARQKAAFEAARQAEIRRQQALLAEQAKAYQMEIMKRQQEGQRARLQEQLTKPPAWQPETPEWQKLTPSNYGPQRTTGFNRMFAPEVVSELAQRGEGFNRMFGYSEPRERDWGTTGFNRMFGWQGYPWMRETQERYPLFAAPYGPRIAAGETSAYPQYYDRFPRFTDPSNIKWEYEKSDWPKPMYGIPEPPPLPPGDGGGYSGGYGGGSYPTIQWPESKERAYSSKPSASSAQRQSSAWYEKMLQWNI